MYSRHVLIIGAFALVIATASVAQDSTPQAIKLQGYLSDNSGGTSVPANGLFTLTFDLFDASLGGGLIASSGSMEVYATDGYYSVNLPFQVAHFDGTPRYIEITVNGEVLSPRLSMLSSPYAFHADTVDGYEGSDLEESAEIATVEDNLQTQIDALVVGTGNTLDQAYDQGGPGAGRIITADAGPVNIEGGLQVLEYASVGTTSPAAGIELHVQKNDEAILRVETAGTYGNVAGVQVVDGQGGWSIGTGANDFGGVGGLGFRSFDQITGMVISSSGQVGIGMTTPDEQLVVAGSVVVGDGNPDGPRIVWRGGAGGAQEFRSRVFDDGSLWFFPGEAQPATLKMTPAGDVEILGMVAASHVRFGDGSIQSTAQLVGPQGPQGPQGEPGPPVTSYCVVANTSGCYNVTCTCDPGGTLLSKGNDECTSDTGSCVVNPYFGCGSVYRGACCVCSPNP